jgi:hypothetical protein
MSDKSIDEIFNDSNMLDLNKQINKYLDSKDKDNIINYINESNKSLKKSLKNLDRDINLLNKLSSKFN